MARLEEMQSVPIDTGCLGMQSVPIAPLTLAPVKDGLSCG